MNNNQVYSTASNIQIANLIRTNMLAILEDLQNKSIDINTDIDTMGQQIFDYNEEDIKEKTNIDYFSGLPGQTITIVDSVFNVTNMSFIDFLKTFKYTWYSRYYRLVNGKYESISESEKNAKPETRTKKRDSAIFLDQYNNPIVFIFKPQFAPILLYFKFGNIEIPKLAIHLYKIINDDSILDSFSKYILESLNKYSYTSIKDSFQNKNYQNHLFDISTQLFSLNEFFCKMTVLLNIVSQHKDVVDKSKQNNLLQKKVRLLTENKDSFEALNSKLDMTLQTVSNSYEQKKLDFNLLQKNHLELENHFDILVRKSKKDTERKRFLRNCNAFYFLIMFLMVLVLFFIDHVIQPNKEDILKKCTTFLLDTFYKVEL